MKLEFKKKIELSLGTRYIKNQTQNPWESAGDGAKQKIRFTVASLTKCPLAKENATPSGEFEVDLNPYR